MPAGQPLCASPGQQPSTQRRAVGSQMRPESLAPQSRSTVHPQRFTPSAPATQAVPSALIAHAAAIEPTTHGTQRLVVASHAGVAPVQADVLASVHCTQRPALRPSVAHAGVAPEQSVAELARHGRHTRRAVSHTGIAPAQSALLVQPTHEFVAVSHTPERQSALATQGTQRPALGPVTAHARTPGSVQSAALAQPRHTRIVGSHTGRDGSMQSLAEAQPTQVFVRVSQRGVSPPQWASVVQGTQRPALVPVEAQAGRVPSMEAHCASVEHATQVRVARSHTGAAGLRTQSALALQRHTPAWRSHTGAVPGQF